LEPQKQTEYSKSLKLDQREEILMDKESDAELEEIHKLMEPSVQSCLSSEDKYQGNHNYVSARTGDVPNVSHFAGPPNGNQSINQSDVSNIHANPLIQDDFFRLH
jgi:hypothetical protein